MGPRRTRHAGAVAFSRKTLVCRVSAALAVALVALRSGTGSFPCFGGSSGAVPVLSSSRGAQSAPGAASQWHRRRIAFAEGVDIVEDSIRLVEGSQSPSPPEQRKTLRILRDVLSLGEADKILSLLRAADFSSLEAEDNPVVTPLQVLAKDGLWRDTFPLAQAVKPVVEARVLPYMRSELGCSSLVAAEVMVRRYQPEERREFRVHFDHNAYATAIVDLSPREGSGLFVGAGPSADSQFFVPFASPGDVAVHGWDVLHGVRLSGNHERVSIVVWAKPREDVEHGTTSWYVDDALSGDPDAEFRLGLDAQEQGDTIRAQRYLSSAAEKGQVYAMHRLGLLLAKSGDQDGASHWMERAAEKGYATAQVDVGDARRKAGRFADAISLYKQAAVQGHGKAKLRLSAMYVFGLGVDDDMKRGFECLLDAANTGREDAQLVLAQLAELTDRRMAPLWAATDTQLPSALLQGALQEQSLGNGAKAIKLLRAAADAGHPQAVARVEALRSLQETSSGDA